MDTKPLYIVMGVSGCGKSTVAKMLAEALNADWLDADDFHSEANKARMHAGMPLTDEERWPWLDILNARLKTAAAENKSVFLACSALKQKYRDRLAAGLPQLRFVYLNGTFALIQERLARRKNHFMPARLLESQFAILEEPRDAIVLDISQPEEQLLSDFKRKTLAAGQC